tara:strand:- start:257 stop:559 length:303 start_codon:yes stop_codon:yes gene_type:complete
MKFILFFAMVIFSSFSMAADFVPNGSDYFADEMPIETVLAGLPASKITDNAHQRSYIETGESTQLLSSYKMTKQLDAKSAIAHRGSHLPYEVGWPSCETI